MPSRTPRPTIVADHWHPAIRALSIPSSKKIISQSTRATMYSYLLSFCPPPLTFERKRVGLAGKTSTLVGSRGGRRTAATVLSARSSGIRALLTSACCGPSFMTYCKGKHNGVTTRGGAWRTVGAPSLPWLEILKLQMILLLRPSTNTSFLCCYSAGDYQKHSLYCRGTRLSHPTRRASRTTNVVVG